MWSTDSPLNYLLAGCFLGGFQAFLDDANLAIEMVYLIFALSTLSVRMRGHRDYLHAPQKARLPISVIQGTIIGNVLAWLMCLAGFYLLIYLLQYFSWWENIIQAPGGSQEKVILWEVLGGLRLLLFGFLSKYFFWYQYSRPLEEAT